MNGVPPSSSTRTDAPSGARRLESDRAEGALTVDVSGPSAAGARDGTIVGE